MTDARRRRRIAMVVSGFPRRSETFALSELVALDAAGSLAAIFATKPGDGVEPHAAVARLAGRVVMLQPGSAIDQAETVAAHLRDSGVAGVHGYFAHTPAEVAAAAAARAQARRVMARWAAVKAKAAKLRRS